MEGIVSIILPYYNGSRFVQETLDSILRQTYRNFELLVVDDGSPDPKESTFIRNAVAQLHDDRFKYIYKPNGGLSDARNFGINNACGEFIAFVDQDDYWMPTKLEKQVRALEGSEGVEFVFTGMDVLPMGGGAVRLEGPSWCGHDGIIEDTYERILRRNFVPASSVLFKKSLIEKAGYSKKSFNFCPDFELFVRMARISDFYYVHESLMVYRLHDAQTIRQQSKLFGEAIWVLFDNPLSSMREKVAASIHFSKLMAGIARLWIRKILDLK